MRKENEMLFHQKINRFISRMKQIWEFWDLLKEPWDSLDGFGRVSSEQVCIRRVSVQLTVLAMAPLPCAVLWWGITITDGTGDIQEISFWYEKVYGKDCIFSIPEKNSWEK